jgi:peptide/nickel transport system permease protein
MVTAGPPAAQVPTPEEPSPAGPKTPVAAGGRRPSPRIAQMKRTLYFLRQNTLAMVGLGIVLFFIFVALYSPFYPAPSESLQAYCGTYTGSGSGLLNSSGGCVTICTYDPTISAPPHPGCYPVPTTQPSIVAPTFTLAPWNPGPLPLGSLTVDPTGSQFFSILPGLVKGAPWSLGIAASVVLSGALIGLVLGAFAGFKGGLTDEAIMRFTDIFLSIPGLLLVLVVLAVFSIYVTTLFGRVELLVGAFVVTWWPFYTRIVRGQVLVTREQKYVEASKASGAKTGRLLFRHVIPNSIYPVFVQMSLDVGTIPLLLGAIIFLGYHVWPSTYFPEWGSISAYSVMILESEFLNCGISVGGCTFPWWQLLFPGLTVFLFAISVNFLSDGLRDALDPRLRR